MLFRSDYAAVMGTNVAGFFNVTQLAIAEMEKDNARQQLLRFIRAGNTVAKVETTARAIAPLIADAPALHRATAGATRSAG